MMWIDLPIGSTFVGELGTSTLVSREGMVSTWFDIDDGSWTCSNNEHVPIRLAGLQLILLPDGRVVSAEGVA